MNKEFDFNNAIDQLNNLDDILDSYRKETSGSFDFQDSAAGSVSDEVIYETEDRENDIRENPPFTPTDSPADNSIDNFEEEAEKNPVYSSGYSPADMPDSYEDVSESGSDSGNYRAGHVREEQAEEEEFDPRFNLDCNADGTRRRRDYSYAGKRVSTTQDMDYSQKKRPEYEELRSSYGENEEYEFDRQYGFTQEEKPDKKSKLKNLFKKKKKEEPYVSPVTGEQFGEDEDAVPKKAGRHTDGSESFETEDGFEAVREKDNFEPVREGDVFESAGESGKEPRQDDDSFPADEGKNKKKSHGLFGRRKKNTETDDLDEDYAGAYRKEDSFIPSSTFGEYLTSRIAAVFLRIRGGVPIENSMGSAYAETEFMGEEMQPLAASRYYGSNVFSLRFRTRIAFVLTIFSFWLSLGAPSPGMLSNLRVATAACLAMEFTVMVLALDIVTNAVVNCFRGKFGADFLAVLSCIFSALDALTVLNGSNVMAHMPLCAVSSLTLCGTLLSSLLSARGMRKALRVPAIGKKKYSVTTEANITGREVTALKSGRPITGFVRRMEEAPVDEIAYGKVSVFLALLILLLALVVAVVKRSFTRLIYINSVILCTSVPFSALLCFALPFFMGSLKLFGNGAALAGWSGVCELGNSRNLIVTDTDVFPEETISMDNVRIFADYDAEKVIVYASSLILQSGCGLVPVFNALMEENGYHALPVDNLEFLSGGGIKGMAEGHVLILGGSDLMRLMNIRVPYRLVTSTSALLSIDGILYGIFNISYKADPRVRKALVSLMRSSRNPVFAIRDFNVTPEMIKEKFDVATDGYDFPPYADRYRISEAKPSGESQISGVVCRDGLGSLTELTDTARKIYCVSRICVLVSLLSAVIGALYAFIHILAAGSLALSSVLLFQLLFNVPVLVLGFLTNIFE